MHIRTAANEDLPLIIHLYQQVARQEGGLARMTDHLKIDIVPGALKLLV